MPKIPPLPAALVAFLGTLASVLVIVQPSLPEPWPAVVGGLLALLTIVGVPVTMRTIRAHGYAAAAVRPPGRQSGRRDAGMSRAGALAAVAAVLLVAATAAVVVMSPAQASPEHRDPGRPAGTSATLACPSPYVAREVRVYGQRIESDVSASGRSQVIAQNDWATTKQEDPRYVVALVCTRSINNAENNELFAWGSK